MPWPNLTTENSMSDQHSSDQISASQSNELLARIDERTKSMGKAVEDIKTMVTSNYVTQQEFKPIKTLVFGAVAIMLIAIVGAIVALVVRP